MGSQQRNQLKMLFFPFMSPGHILPMLDMAKLFALRGVHATILTTPANARLIRPSLLLLNQTTNHIELCLIPFPSADFGLPDGCENMSSVPPSNSSRNNFYAACSALLDPFADLLRQLQPDCIVTDMFFPWTCDVASELGIPRLVFHGVSLFALSGYDSTYLEDYPEDNPDEESFLIPGIPHQIRMLKSQMPTFEGSEPAMVEIGYGMRRTDAMNYGVVANSFYELEPDYVRHYRDVVGRRTWLLGPLSLCSTDGGTDGKSSVNVDDDFCIRWLDNRKSAAAGSVVYICFGSIGEFTVAQLRELALGLEGSGHPFVWVVGGGCAADDDWMPEGFEERVKDKGLVVRGWAPQILILSHPAVGGFVTHCGWNSSLEGVSAGLPLVTWPLFAEQFFNERLIVDVLRIGVAVGVKKYAMNSEERELVEAAEIAEAVGRVMGEGEEAEERRRRAKDLEKAAKTAVEKGGSSYNDASDLIQELMNKKCGKS